MKKIMSLCLLSFLYCICVCIIQIKFRNGNDVAVGILYSYSNILYLVGLWISFLLYGNSKTRKVLCNISCIVFQFCYIDLWISIHKTMPYESTFYIVFGLMIYTLEFFYLKYDQK